MTNFSGDYGFHAKKAKSNFRRLNQADRRCIFAYICKLVFYKHQNSATSTGQPGIPDKVGN